MEFVYKFKKYLSEFWKNEKGLWILSEEQPHLPGEEMRQNMIARWSEVVWGGNPGFKSPNSEQVPCRRKAHHSAGIRCEWKPPNFTACPLELELAYLVIPKSDTFTERSLSTKQFRAAFGGKTKLPSSKSGQESPHIRIQDFPSLWQSSHKIQDRLSKPQMLRSCLFFLCNSQFFKMKLCSHQDFHASIHPCQTAWRVLHIKHGTAACQQEGKSYF